MNGAGTSIANNSTVSPNLVYNNVSFTSADPAAVQNTTGVIKTVTNTDGTQTQIYQQPLSQGGSQGVLLPEIMIRP